MVPSLVLRALFRLADVQIQRPWHVVLAVLVTLVPAAFATSRLELRTEFSQLLPENKPSVIEMRRVTERVPGMSTVTVIARASNPEALKRFIDALTPKLLALESEWITSVDAGTRPLRDFVEKHKHLYASLKDIQELHDDVVERYDYEVTKHAGLDLGLDAAEETEGTDGAPPEVDAESLKRRFSRQIEDAKASAPGLDGYYIGEGGTLGAILVRTSLPAASLRAFDVVEQIRGVVSRMDLRGFDPALEVSYGGNAVTSAEEHRDVTADLGHVGRWGVGLILAVVVLYFLRIRTLFAMTLTIGIGCLWAFAWARLTVGYLNSASGFLASIIAGNGINFGIIYMARYIEARRDQKLPVAEAVRVAHRDTHSATLAAAGAALVAYGSLVATDFQGFRHFGLIGGSGMVLCWVATYVFLPAFLVLSERRSPLFEREPAWRQRLKGVYGYPFAWLARSFPRALTVGGAALGLVLGATAVVYFSSDRMEYDLRRIKNDASASGGRTREITARVDAFTSSIGQDGKAILTERRDQVPELVSELERRRDAAPTTAKPFAAVISYLDLLPRDQPAKLELLETIKDRLERARARGFISEKDWKELEPHIPKELEPIELSELPEQARMLFTEKDGTLGNIVYIVPERTADHEDAHYILRWADSFREVRLSTGEVIRGSGAPVIYADMLLNVAEDAPTAILLSLIGTVLVIVFAFRDRHAALFTLFTLALGVAWLVGILALTRVRWNFLNFIALPITIGIGADYALNVVKRWQLERAGDLKRALTETGGAVVLCSLTTTLGYSALLLSMNGAVRSFGFAAALGEVTTLLAAMLVLPAALYWSRLRSGANADPALSAFPG